MKKLAILLVLNTLLAPLVAAQAFNIPESAVYDFSSQRLFVSNYGGANILQIDKDGGKTVFKNDLPKPLGMLLANNVLYTVNATKSVKGFSLETSKKVFDIEIPEAVFLNDITYDGEHYFYVTDSVGGAVFRIDVRNSTYIKLLETEFKSPNGIVYDERNNRLVICYFKKDANLDEILLGETPRRRTLVATPFHNLDGIVQDELGRFYINSWGEGSFAEGFKKQGAVYRFDHQFKEEPELLKEGLYGPADLFYKLDSRELIIPLFLENQISLVPVPPTSVHPEEE